MRCCLHTIRHLAVFLGAALLVAIAPATGLAADPSPDPGQPHDPWARGTGEYDEQAHAEQSTDMALGKVAFWTLLGVVAVPVTLIRDLVVNGEWSGELGVEARPFFHDAEYPDQKDHAGSIYLEPEVYRDFGSHSFTFVPFARYDAEDARRTHWDVRELFAQFVFPKAELSIGARTIFWGVTESVHLVDVINQTDLVESIDGEEKLGQPMVQLTVPGAAGTLDLILMPYFRERTFPGKKGRLRGPMLVETDFVLYESGDRQNNLDAAARYQHYLGPLEVAVSHFSGTSREPVFIPGASCLAIGCPAGKLVQQYNRIDQTGLEAQLILGEWLLKLESIRKAGMTADPTHAWAAGFEYTFTGIFGSQMDLGVLGEWLRDTRPGYLAMPFDNDLMTGVRLAVNDLGSTELLAGFISDLENNSWAGFVEASRRLGEQFTIDGEVRIFGNPSPADPLYALRNDDFGQLTLAFHF